VEGATTGKATSREGCNVLDALVTPIADTLAPRPPSREANFGVLTSRRRRAYSDLIRVTSPKHKRLAVAEASQGVRRNVTRGAFAQRIAASVLATGTAAIGGGGSAPAVTADGLCNVRSAAGPSAAAPKAKAPAPVVAAAAIQPAKPQKFNAGWSWGILDPILEASARGFIAGGSQQPSLVTRASTLAIDPAFEAKVRLANSKRPSQARACKERASKGAKGATSTGAGSGKDRPSGMLQPTARFQPIKMQKATAGIDLQGSPIAALILPKEPSPTASDYLDLQTMHVHMALLTTAASPHDDGIASQATSGPSEPYWVCDLAREARVLAAVRGGWLPQRSTSSP
jgi:hypothetical protein